MSAPQTTQQITVRVPVTLLDQLPRDRSAAIRDRLDLSLSLLALRDELRESRQEVQALRAEVRGLRQEQEAGQKTTLSALRSLADRLGILRRMLDALGPILDRPWRGWFGTIQHEGRSASAALSEAKKTEKRSA